MNKRNELPLRVMKTFYLDRFQPQLYTEALSQLELLYAMMKHLNLVIDRCNSFQDVVNEIITYITEFNTKVKEATIEVLQEFYENGTLKEILEDVSEEFFADIQRQIDEQFEVQNGKISNLENAVEANTTDINNLIINNTIDKSGELNWKLKFRALVTTGQNDSDFNPNLAYYTQAQGGTIVNKNGIKYYVLCSNRENYQNTYNNDIRLRKYTDGNMSSLTTLDVPNFGHGNGMCYNPLDDCLYLVSGAHYVGSTNTPDFKVAKIDFTTFSLIDIQDFGAYIPNNATTHFSSVNYFNEKLYFNSKGVCYEFNGDWDNPEFTLVFTAKDSVINSYQGTLSQATFYTDKYVLWLTHSPSCLYVMDTVSRNLAYKYDIKDKFEGWKLGEVEDIDFDLTTGEINLVHTFNLCVTNYNQLRHNGFISTNIYNNILNGNAEFFDDGRPSMFRTLYVNRTNSIDNGTCTLPTGRINAPFYCVQEAFNFANNNDNIEIGSIYLRSNDRNSVYGIATKTMYVNGAIPDVENSGTTPTTCYRIGGALIRGNIGLTSVTAVNYNTALMSAHKAVLKFLHGYFSCNYVFSAPWLGGSSLGQSDYFTHGISVEAGFLNYANGYTQAQVEAQSGQYEAGQNYTLITRALNTNATSNCHGQATVSLCVIA